MNNTVTFKVAGNDVISFIDRIKSKSDELTNKMLADAKQQSNSSREQLKLVEDQVKALERRNRVEAEATRGILRERRDALKQQNEIEFQAKSANIQARTDLGTGKKNTMIGDAAAARDIKDEHVDKEYRDQLIALREQERQSVMQSKLLKDNIETIKSTSNIQLAQLKRNNGELVDELDKNATPMQELAKDIAEEKYHDKTKDPKEEKQGPGFLSSMLSVENLNKFLNNAQTFTSTQNGFDLIKPASTGIGQIVGGLLGGIIGTLIEPGGGTIMGAGIGGSLGSTIGGGVGEFEQRRAMAAQDFLKARYGYEATTQRSIDHIGNTANMGLSASEFMQVMKQVAVASGSSKRANENALDVVSMQKGLGISQETSQQFLTLFRGTQKDISNLVAGVMEKGKNGLFAGGDYTFLNEFLGKMANLQSSLRQNTDDVSTGAAYDILNRFNSLGGAFRASDPRSSGLINQINNALVHPSSDAGNALSFMALRQSNPNMGIADLMMEREKGLSSPTYLKSMLQYIDMMGGDDQFKRMNIAGLLGVNQAAAKRIYDNRKLLMSGKISSEEIEKYTSGDFQKLAESKTTPIEKNTADIANGMLGQWYDTLDAMQDSFKVAMESAFAGATIEMKNGSIKFTGTPKQNAAPSGKAVMDSKTARMRGMNTDGTIDYASANYLNLMY